MLLFRGRIQANDNTKKKRKYKEKEKKKSYMKKDNIKKSKIAQDIEMKDTGHEKNENKENNINIFLVKETISFLIVFLVQEVSFHSRLKSRSKQFSCFSVLASSSSDLWE